jgi:hypothetical protein
MDWVLTGIGIVMIVVGVNDVFRTFVHPSARGRLSTALVRLPWVAVRRIANTSTRAAGPVGVLLVMIIWVVLQVVGWALVYLPHVSTGFSYSEQVEPGQFGAFAEAIYMSIVVLGTLGLGDVVITQPALRLLSPIEALIGFVLLTAGISWIMQLYPALARRRAWALHVSHLRSADFASTVRVAGAASGAAGVLHGLAASAAQVRVDLGQHAETYYFTERDAATCLPTAMRYCADLADVAEASGDPALAPAGATLRAAVDDLAAFLQERYIPRADGGTSAFIQAALDDHGCDGPS